MKLIGVIISILVAIIVFGAIWPSMQNVVTGLTTDSTPGDPGNVTYNMTDSSGRALMSILPVLIIVGVVIAIIAAMGILKRKE